MELKNKGKKCVAPEQHNHISKGMKEPLSEPVNKVSRSFARKLAGIKYQFSNFVKSYLQMSEIAAKDAEYRACMAGLLCRKNYSVHAKTVLEGMFSRFNPICPETVEEIARLSRSRKSPVRLSACSALGSALNSSNSSVQAMELLKKFMASSRPAWRAAAALAFRESVYYGGAMRAAVPELSRLLGDPDTDVRRFAAMALEAGAQADRLKNICMDLALPAIAERIGVEDDADVLRALIRSLNHSSGFAPAEVQEKLSAAVPSLIRYITLENGMIALDEALRALYLAAGYVPAQGHASLAEAINGLIGCERYRNEGLRNSKWFGSVSGCCDKIIRELGERWAA
jgi:HEAT repeat protein